MANRVLRGIAMVLGCVTLIWAGYVLGRVQNIVDLARLYRDVDTDRYSFARGDVVVHFERLGGAGKPYIRAADGTDLLELSDWDRGSRIVVDGAAYELVRLYPRSSVDYERNRLVTTLHGDGWQLEREVTIGDDNAVRINHAFIARRTVRRVDVAVAHARPNFDRIEVQERGVVATVSQQTGGGGSLYQIQIVAEGSMRFRPGDGATPGLSNFFADLTITDPPRDQRSALGSELLRIERIAG